MANEVELKVSMEGGQVVRQEIDGVSHSVGQMASGAVTAAKAMMGVFAGFAVNQVIGKLVSVQREFDVLNSSLITVTGSSAQADREFAWIKQFAATTPYQLNEVTGAFVKMKALGLDASAKALGSYGNTASAMGKGLNQMIEAVADAATGEFERLKEFGIKARQQGDQVSLTFQGVTTKIGNNAAEITSYLQDIGNNHFAGAMAQRAATLDGAISNLTDTWDELFRTINTNNAGGFIYDSVTLASGSIKDAIAIMNAMSGAADANAKSTGAMATVQEALAVTFETVAVLGANVKYVLFQVGNEIGGLAAQAVQILQGNFAGAAAIRASMVADANAARAEIDATTARILGARAAAQDLAAWNTRNASAGADPRRLDLATAANAVTEKAIKLTKEQTDAIKAAAKARAEAADYNTKAVDALYDAQEKTRMQAEDSIKTARTTLEQIEFETALLGMNTEQRALATMERELERQGIVKGTQAYDAYIEKLREAMSLKSGKEAGINAAKDMADAQRKAAEESGKWWEEKLMDAFTAGFDGWSALWNTIKNTLKTQVLKVMVQGTMTATGMGAYGNAVAGGTGGTDMLGVAGSIASGTGVMGAAGNIIGGAMGAGTVGTGISATIGNALAAVPIYGWIALAVLAVASWASGKGETRSGATYDTGADGLARYQQGPSGGEIAGDAARALFNSAKTSIEETLKIVGSSAVVTGYTAGLESSDNGKGFAFAGGYIDGKAFGDSGGRDGGQFAYQTMNSEQAMAAYVNELKKSTLEALQAAADIPAIISTQLAGIDINALDQAGLDNLMNAIGGTVSAVNNFVAQINTSGIAELHDLGFAAAAGLIQFSGGLENLQTNLNAYYTNFYSAEEQRLQQIKNINAATAGSGLDAAVADAKAYRELVESWGTVEKLATEEGQKMYAALLSVAGAMADVTKTSGDAADELAKKAQSDANANYRAELEYAQEINDRIQAKQTEIKTAWQGITDGIMTEVDRIRGTLQSGPESLAAAQAEFAIALAQTRAGDQVAGQSLPGLSQNLDSIALKEAGSLLDYQRIMGRTANSLAALGGGLTDQYGLKPLTSEADPMVVELRGVRTTLIDGFGLKPTNSANPIVEELRTMRRENAELRDEIKGLRAESQSSAVSNSKTAKLLDTVTQGGTTLRTKAIA